MKEITIRYCSSCGHIGELPKTMLKCCPTGPGELILLTELKQAVEIGFAFIALTKAVALKQHLQLHQ